MFAHELRQNQLLLLHYCGCWMLDLGHMRFDEAKRARGGLEASLAPRPQGGDAVLQYTQIDNSWSTVDRYGVCLDGETKQTGPFAPVGERELGLSDYGYDDAGAVDDLSSVTAGPARARRDDSDGGVQGHRTCTALWGELCSTDEVPATQVRAVLETSCGALFNVQRRNCNIVGDEVEQPLAASWAPRSTSWLYLSATARGKGVKGQGSRVKGQKCRLRILSRVKRQASSVKRREQRAEGRGRRAERTTTYDLRTSVRRSTSCTRLVLVLELACQRTQGNRVIAPGVSRFFTVIFGSQPGLTNRSDSESTTRALSANRVRAGEAALRVGAWSSEPQSNWARAPRPRVGRVGGLRLREDGEYTLALTLER
ncbi:hypothetical protein FIBSPDRAFT_899166 [Athelia psychrophila]|uniref:Uncharacterized protein n=1 Tax=Athelia psychrophila TaxID=1759441 RepID=A0A166A1T6_9AGAM|nr:hypothetical protein FIBSPDRAFT_899166 [Fibularhizoctonia sp. CBS 109695]